MSEFTGAGFPDYPNLYLDEQAVHNVVEWSDARHNHKTAQYREFTRRERILPRHMAIAKRILELLEFEAGCRDKETEAPDDISELTNGTNV